MQGRSVQFSLSTNPRGAPKETWRISEQDETRSWQHCRSRPVEEHTPLRVSYRKSAAQFRLKDEENSVETRKSVSLCSERQLKWDPMVTLKCLKSSYPLEEKYKINQVRYGWVWGENLRLNRGQGNCGNWKAMSKEEKAIQWIIVLPDSGSGLSSPENGSERGWCLGQSLFSLPWQNTGQVQPERPAYFSHS